MKNVGIVIDTATYLRFLTIDYMLNLRCTVRNLFDRNNRQLHYWTSTRVHLTCHVYDASCPFGNICAATGFEAQQPVWHVYCKLIPASAPDPKHLKFLGLAAHTFVSSCACGVCSK